MAEVGLVRFAAVALEVAEAVVPPYRSKFSKHLFTQPQLLVILCLMRYEDWTFREAEVRLAEHSDLRAALRLKLVPDYTTLYRFLRRLDEKLIERVLERVVEQMPQKTQSGTTVAVDATGLAPGAISTYFVRRLRDSGCELSRKFWLKWIHKYVNGIVTVDVSRRLVLSQMAVQGPSNDGPALRPLTTKAAQSVPIAMVLADGEFDSERNHTHVRQVLGAMSVIPAKRGKSTWNIKGVRREMREAFPKHLYGQRSLAESVFSSAKRKLSDRAPGRSAAAQIRQALLLGLAYNLYRLRPNGLKPICLSR